MKFGRRAVNNLYVLGITVIFLLVIAAAIYVFCVDYDALVATITASVHKNGLENKIRNEVFNRHQFLLLQRIFCIIFILSGLFYGLALRYRFYLINLCIFFALSVQQSGKALGLVYKNNLPQQNRQVFTFIIMVVLFSVYEATNSFLTYDEMWSYNYYTANHFYYSFFTYSNYPLFEMSTHLFKWLPFSMKIDLRLSSLLFGTASCFLLYGCLRKYFNNHFTAMAGLMAFATMQVEAVYTTLARGIVHELFFAIACIFSFLYWADGFYRKHMLVIYFLAAVLGVYAMPTHLLLLLFLLFAGVLIVHKKSKADFFLFLKVNLFILAGIIILYAPVLLTTGLAIFRNIVESKPPYYKVFILAPYYLRNVWLFYGGYGQVSVVLISVALLVLFILRNKIPAKYNFIALLAAGLLLVAVCFYFITGLRYPGRSIAFGAFAIPLFVSLFAQMASYRLNLNVYLKTGTGIAGLLLFFLSMGYYHYLRNASPVDKYVAFVSTLLSGKHVVSVYDNSSPASQFYYYYPGIEYYYRIAHKTVELTLSAPSSMRYKPLAGAGYDCIVYDSDVTDSSRAALYQELYRDPSAKFKIWIRNDLIKKP